MQQPPVNLEVRPPAGAGRAPTIGGGWACPRAVQMPLGRARLPPSTLVRCTARSRLAQGSLPRRPSEPQHPPRHACSRAVPPPTHSRGPQDLKFGTVFTDHMLLAEHEVERGWGAPAVRPLGLLPLHPASQVLHYGERQGGGPAGRSLGAGGVRGSAIQRCGALPGRPERLPTAHPARSRSPKNTEKHPPRTPPGMTCFEGLKAYHGVDGRLRLFRPGMNMARLRRSARRLQLADFCPQARARRAWAAAAALRGCLLGWAGLGCRSHLLPPTYRLILPAHPCCRSCWPA